MGRNSNTMNSSRLHIIFDPINFLKNPTKWTFKRSKFGGWKVSYFLFKSVIKSYKTIRIFALSQCCLDFEFVLTERRRFIYRVAIFTYNVLPVGAGHSSLWRLMRLQKFQNLLWHSKACLAAKLQYKGSLNCLRWHIL
jgi:hypothetical protein